MIGTEDPTGYKYLAINELARHNDFFFKKATNKLFKNMQIFIRLDDVDDEVRSS